MTWINALGPGSWILLGSLPVWILLLYFLKLRRQPLQVPSTYLWTRTVEDLHVNSLWQRLRSSLLLLLQILLVFLLILACLRPGCAGDELQGDRFIFLIDNSASMSARDLPERTRLAEAQRLVKQAIDRMGPEDTAMLISFSNRAEVVQSYTRNTTLLKRKVDGIRQTQRSTDLTEALTAASGLANPGRTSTDETDIQVADSLPARLMIYSDGGVRSVPNFSLGNLTPEYFPVGGYGAAGNVGFTAFALSDESGAQLKMQLFAQLQNSLDQDRHVDVQVLVEDRLFDAQAQVALKAGETKGLSFDLSALVASIRTPQRIQLRIEQEDVYPQDNTVFGILNPPRPARILVVTSGNEYLRLALETESVKRIAAVTFRNRDYLQDPQYKTDAALGNFDLILYDNCSPAEYPMCSTVFWGAAPPGDQWAFAPRQFPTVITNYDQSHPLMTTLQLLRLSIVESAPLTPPAGSQVLLETTGGPIMALGTRESYQDLVISFPLAELQEQGDVSVNTNWPSQLSFPLFIQNVVQYLAGGARYFTAENVAPGALLKMRIPPVLDRVTVRTPDRREIEIPRGRDNWIAVNETELCGWYDVLLPLPGEAQNQPFAVNLLDPRESQLTVREKLEIGFEQVAGTTTTQSARQEYWKWLVGSAVVILLAEWYLYNRRVWM